MKDNHMYHRSITTSKSVAGICMKQGQLMIPFVCAILLLAFSQRATAQTTTTRDSLALENVTSAQLYDSEHFGDYTVEEVLRRFSGVQTDLNGDIMFRGYGVRPRTVLLNGQRIATDGWGTREVDLSAFPVELFESVELINRPDASYSGESTGGIVNLSTHQEKGDNGRRLSTWLGGNTLTNYINRTGVGARAWITYGETISEKLQFDATFSVQQEQRGADALDVSYGIFDGRTSPQDVVESIDAGLQIEMNDRIGGSVALTFLPDDNSTFGLQSSFNIYNTLSVDHRDQWVANGDWIDAETTGDDGEEGWYAHVAQRNKTERDRLIIHGFGEHLYEDAMISYSVGWNRSTINHREYDFPFYFTDVNLGLNWENRDRPEFEILNRENQIQDNGNVDRQFINGDNFARLDRDYVDNIISADLDGEYKLGDGWLKGGIATDFVIKDGDYNQNQFEYNRSLRMVSFNTLREPNRNVEVFNGTYELPWMIDSYDARLFFDNQQPLFEGDESYRQYQSGINNFEAFEQQFSGYLLYDIELGSLAINAGVRVESDNSEYDGHTLVFDEDGDFVSNEKKNQSYSGSYILPTLLVDYALNEDSKVFVTARQSITRPDFQLRAPYERIDNELQFITRGNSGLDPEKATTFELGGETLLNPSTFFGATGFYTTFSDVIAQETETISTGDFTDYSVLTWNNSDRDAQVFGAEVFWNQRFTFLPGMLSNFASRMNYTWSESEYTPFRGGSTELPYHRPHVLNASLSYSQARFFGRLNYIWNDAALTGLASNQQVVPANGGALDYRDIYADGWKQLSLHMSYQITDRFRFWTTVRNLLWEKELKTYEYDRDEYPLSTIAPQGMDIRVGLRFDL